MKHIIDSEAVEKLVQKTPMVVGSSADIIHADDLRALLESSPKADDENTPPDVYDIAVDTGDGIYHTAEVVHFQQNGSKRMIQVRLGEPQADDVRKDAWISVEDRLPSLTKQVEVVFYAKPYEWWTGLFTPKGFLNNEYTENVFQYHQHWGDDEYHTIENVTHWQPLPSPPLDKARE